MVTQITDPLLHMARDRDEPYYIKCKLSGNSHPKAFDTPHCEECGEQKQGILLHYTNFIAPCKCCGSPDHGLLEHIPCADNTTIMGYAQVKCPSVWTSCVGKMIQEDRMSMKYRPCPQKLAEAHNFNEAKAKVTLKQCYTQGSGWHMHTQQFYKLTEEVAQICYDTLNPQFTRDTIHLHGEQEDDDELDLQ
jgi:hypothetical protein